METTDYLQGLREHERNLQARLNVLERVSWLGKDLGWPVPSREMRKGKYLVLWFTLPSGRYAHYIGADPEAVKAALDGIEAHREYETISLQLAQLREMISQAETELFLLQKRCRSYLQELQFAD